MLIYSVDKLEDESHFMFSISARSNSVLLSSNIKQYKIHITINLKKKRVYFSSSGLVGQEMALSAFLRMSDVIALSALHNSF